MATVLSMLDRALILAQHELEALNAGNVEEAESYFMERSELLSKAYNNHDEVSTEDYVIKLIAIQGYNQLICEVGEELKASLRSDILASQKSTKAAKAYITTSYRY